MKIILNVEDVEDMLLAVKAAEWLKSKPAEKKDAIVSYGDYPVTRDFYVRRTKTGISVRRI